jgi:hypothetical protein
VQISKVTTKTQRAIGLLRFVVRRRSLKLTHYISVLFLHAEVHRWRITMPFSIQFLGVGGAFSMPITPGDLWTAPMQSNMVITAPTGRRMLFDCGTDIRLSAQMCGYGPNSFDAVYISHEHADHAGGLEWLFLNRLFGGGEKPLLIAEKQVLQNVWTMLRPSLRVTTNGLMKLRDYVTLNPMYDMSFIWETLRFTLVKNIHVNHPDKPFVSYGVRITGGLSDVYISADTVFNERRICGMAYGHLGHRTTIFHDCEVGFKTGVHAHYDELLTLPDDVRAMMWLYHYNPLEAAKKNAGADGFRGFVTKGKTFEFN